MKRFLVFLAVAFALFAAAQVPKEVVKAGESAYNLWEWSDGALKVICSGSVMALGDHKVFVSAGHCTQEGNAYRYYISRSKDPDSLVRVRLLDRAEAWPNSDWSVFKIPDDFKGPAIPACSQDPEIGERVWVWTGPLGMLPILREGLYSGKLHWPDDPDTEEEVGGMHFVQINGDGGSSGSIMLRMEKGKVCGWGIWVGGFRTSVKLDGALVVPIPDPSSIWQGP